MANYDVKLTLSRSQRRELDRAARLQGLKTGPWVRAVALAAAKGGGLTSGRPGPNGAVSGVSAPVVND